MPGERRNLRSNKDTSSSTNGEKPRSNSQSSNSKDKPVPTRATSSKGKVPAKKGTTGSAKETTGEKPQSNGTEPVENGVNGIEDVEMVDEGPEKIKIGTKQNGEDEMTVVVPPPKSSKLSGQPGKDAEGDVAMDGAGTIDTDAAEAEQIDPKMKAVAGQCYISQP